MLCGRQLSLTRLYSLYSKEYSEAVTQLSGITRSVAKDDWDLALKLAEQARKRSAEILLQLKRHKLEHGC